MKPYVVKQGDHLTKLAHKMGFDADTVWNDSKNAELKKARKPDILKAGDVLWVPDEPKKKLSLTAQSSNAYVAKVPKVPMKIALSDGGKVTMPLTKTFWSPRFGMLQDRFGIGWMVSVAPAGQC